MGWRDLLQAAGEAMVSPWVGGRCLRDGPRTWRIDGALPEEHGWYSFVLAGRTASVEGRAEPARGVLRHDHASGRTANRPLTSEEITIVTTRERSRPARTGFEEIMPNQKDGRQGSP